MNIYLHLLVWLMCTFPLRKNSVLILSFYSAFLQLSINMLTHLKSNSSDFFHFFLSELLANLIEQQLVEKRGFFHEF